MTDQANANEARDGGFLAPRPDGAPGDRCFRCGVETAPGVGLCERHNPNGLSGPSATQMHATIFVGIALGVVALFLLARLAVSTSGPFGVELTSASVGPDGSAAIAYTITNEGEDAGVADCRVTRDGVARPEDLAFRTASVPAGGSVRLERTLPPPPGLPGYDAEAISVTCS